MAGARDDLPRRGLVDLRSTEEKKRDQLFCSWCGLRFIDRGRLYDHWRNSAACRKNANR